MVVQPTTFADLRNVHLRQGKAELRSGLSALSTFPAGTAIAGIHSIRSRNAGVVLTYDTVSGEVTLWLTDADGLNPVNRGVVMQVPTGMTPRLLMADAYDRLFIAHDEADYASRAPTVVYNAAANAVEPFQWGTDPDTLVPMADIRFRGVTRHLNYLIGWGWGDEADPDRPETLRISLPGEPNKFQRAHYFLVGARGDALIKADTVGQVCSLRKDTEIYELFGYDRATFGVRPADMLFGQVSSRLSVVAGDRVYFWSQSGPRVVLGNGASADLALPLDLGGPPPDALASAIETETAFAAYDAEKREVLFVFSRWCYVLHLEQTDGQWSFRVFGVPLSCAGIIYKSVVGTLLVAEAWAEQRSVLFAPPHAMPEVSASVTLDVDLLGVVHGGEQLQWWGKDVLTNTWTQRSSQGLTPNQLTAVQSLGLQPGVSNTIACRVTRVGRPMPAYTSPNPDAWPATARRTILPLLAAPPILTATQLQDGTGRVQVVVMIAPLLERWPYFPWISLQAEYDAGAGWQPAIVEYVSFPVRAIIDATGYYSPTVKFRIRRHTTETDSPWSEIFSVAGTAPSGSLTNFAMDLPVVGGLYQEGGTLNLTWNWAGNTGATVVLTKVAVHYDDGTGGGFDDTTSEEIGTIAASAQVFLWATGWSMVINSPGGVVPKVTFSLKAEAFVGGVKVAENTATSQFLLAS
jgi:hypothetical protein